MALDEIITYEFIYNILYLSVVSFIVMFFYGIMKQLLPKPNDDPIIKMVKTTGIFIGITIALFSLLI